MQNLTNQQTDVHYNMKLNTYIILDRAVREATYVGFSSAMSNKEINDSPEKLIDFIADHIMSELSNIIIFDDMTKEDPITIDPKMAAAMAILGEEFERQKKEEGK